MGIKFTPIREAYLHGEFAIRNNRMVEVIRVDTCPPATWDTFEYVDNRMVRHPGKRHTQLSRAEARERAIAFLKSDKRPELLNKASENLPASRRVQTQPQDSSVGV